MNRISSIVGSLFLVATGHAAHIETVNFAFFNLQPPATIEGKGYLAEGSKSTNYRRYWADNSFRFQFSDSSTHSILLNCYEQSLQLSQAYQALGIKKSPKVNFVAEATEVSNYPTYLISSISECTPSLEDDVLSKDEQNTLYQQATALHLSGRDHIALPFQSTAVLTNTNVLPDNSMILSYQGVYWGGLTTWDALYLNPLFGITPGLPFQVRVPASGVTTSKSPLVKVTQLDSTLAQLHLVRGYASMQELVAEHVHSVLDLAVSTDPAARKLRVLRGDLNRNNTLDMEDVDWAQKLAVGLPTPLDPNFVVSDKKIADISENGVFNTLDVSGIQRAAWGSGDLNLDANIDVKDVRVLRNVIKKLQCGAQFPNEPLCVLTRNEQILGDLNRDNVIDEQDLILLVVRTRGNANDAPLFGHKRMRFQRSEDVINHYLHSPSSFESMYPEGHYIYDLDWSGSIDSNDLDLLLELKAKYR